MAIYEVETEDGVFEVEVEDDAPAQAAQPTGPSEGQTLLNNVMAGGPAGISWGAKPQDVPYIAGTALDQFVTGGQVSTALEQPFQAAIAGAPGMNIAQAANVSSFLTGQGEVFESTGLTQAPTASGRATQAALGIAIPSAVAGKLSQSKSFKKPSSVDVLDMVEQAKNEQNMLDVVIGRQEIEDITKLKSMNQQKVGEIKNTLLDIDKTVIPNAADKATINGRPVFMSWAKDVSERYGAKYRPLIEGKSTTLEKYMNTLSETEARLGTQNVETAALSGPDKVLRSELNRIQKIVEENGWEKAKDMAMRLDEIDDILKKGIFKGNFGKQYTYGDRALTEVRRGLTDLLSKEVPELSVLKAEFAPDLQFKNEAFNLFQPFNKSGEFDATRGINFFQRYAQGKLKPDEMRFVDAVKKKFDPNFTKEIDSAVSQKTQFMKEIEKLAAKESEDLLNIKMSHDFERAKLHMEHEKHLALLDEMLAQTKKSEALGRLGAKAAIGVGGAAGVGFASKLGYDFAKIVTPNE